jgi:hypothetical protein
MGRTQITRHDVRLACPSDDPLGLSAKHIPLCGGSIPREYVQPAFDYLYSQLAGITTEVFGEEPSGDRNGVSKVYACAHVYISGKLRVMLNGLDIRKGQDWAEGPGSNEFTMEYGLYENDDLLVDYRY